MPQQNATNAPKNRMTIDFYAGILSGSFDVCSSVSRPLGRFILFCNLSAFWENFDLKNPSCLNIFTFSKSDCSNPKDLAALFEPFLNLCHCIMQLVFLQTRLVLTDSSSDGPTY